MFGMKTIALSDSRSSKLRPLKFMGGKQPIPAVKQTISRYLFDQVAATFIRKVGVIPS
jgi:dTDP-glucose pyrophosphorylase